MSHSCRAEVVGSLLRPQFLTRAREELQAGAITNAEFKRVEDRAVDLAIAMQEGAGVDVITDGEFRRATFFDALFASVSGIESMPGNEMPWHNAERDDVWQVPSLVTGKLRRQRSIVGEEFGYARARARRPVKVTVPSPLMLYNMWSNEHSRPAYTDAFEMFLDAAEIARQEVKELLALGCEYIQIDAPELTMILDPDTRQWINSIGIDTERLLTEGIEIIDSVVDVPERGDTYFAIHLCRGNNAGMWVASGGYDMIAQNLFARAKSFDAYLLEYDDARSGTFQPLAKAPDDKKLVLGLVSSKVATLETADELTHRIDDASRYVSREQLALSTQCGFASMVTGPNPLSEDDEEAKLALVAEVAHHALG